LIKDDLKQNDIADDYRRFLSRHSALLHLEPIDRWNPLRAYTRANWWRVMVDSLEWYWRVDKVLTRT